MNSHCLRAIKWSSMCMTSKMTASWWRNQMPDVKATTQKSNLLFSNWVVSHLPAVTALHYEMCTNVTDGSGECPWLIFVNSLIHPLWVRCGCRWMELRWVGWTDRGIEWLLLLLFSMSNLGWKNLSCYWVKNSWTCWTNGMEDLLCCLVLVYSSRSCLALFKPLHLSFVHLLLPPTSCFAVVILIPIVCMCVKHCLCGRCVVNVVYMVVSCFHVYNCLRHNTDGEMMMMMVVVTYQQENVKFRGSETGCSAEACGALSNSTTIGTEGLQRWNKEPEFVAIDASSAVSSPLVAGVTWNWLNCDLQTFNLCVTSSHLLTNHPWSCTVFAVYNTFDVATAVSPCDETRLVSSHFITWTVKSHLCPSPHDTPTHLLMEKTVNRGNYRGGFLFFFSFHRGD